MPTGTASRSAPPPAPGRTPPEPLPPVQTKGQSSSARRAVCPGLFLLPIFPPLALLPARCTGSPAESVRISDGPVDDHTSTPPPQQITPPTRTASQKQTDTNSAASAAPMTPQPTSCTACTPCQTSQQPAAHRQHLPTPHPASPATHMPQQITPPTAKNHPPQTAAGGVRFFT